MSDAEPETRLPETERLLDAAAAELRRERRRASDELEALRTFESRIRSVSVEEPSHGTAPRGNGLLVSPDGGNRLADVRAAYEETVMNVPHYVEEYDDTYRESIREEFNDHLAVALTEGECFNERCKRALLSAVADAKSGRRSLVGAVDTERESLAEATETLTAIAGELEDLAAFSVRKESFGQLDAYRNRLDVLEEKCETVSDRRQTEVFEQRRFGWLPALLV